jgi:hypothetical protein
MHRSYCTLFDRNYLFQGVALHDSLLVHAGDFTLYILAMDEESFVTLRKLGRPSMVPIRLDDLIDDEARVVRSNTTHGQFCWVSQPLICQHVLDLVGVDMVTYLEADSLFFSDPEPLFRELGSGSVSLVPHNFSREFDNSTTAGQFCVQFNAFRNDSFGREVLYSWRKACFNYDSRAPSVYPGQTCLDDWPTNFRNVKVIEHRGAGVAPWNVRGYRLEGFAPPFVDKQPVIFYHYHQYSRLRSGSHELGSYPMDRLVVDTFYFPYVQALRAAEESVRRVDADFNYRRLHADPPSLMDVLRTPTRSGADALLTKVKRQLRGRYNVYSDEDFPKLSPIGQTNG